MKMGHAVLLVLLSSCFCLTTSDNVDALCKQCKCTTFAAENAIDVDCERRALTTVPGGSSWPQNARIMDLAYNFIVSLSVLEKSNITTLSMHSNKLSHIAPDVFQMFPHLQVLDLSRNALTSMHVDTFQNLDNLRVLNISDNKIRTLPSEIFRSLPSLEKLRMGHNPLRYMDKTWFKKLHRLHFLDMASVGAHFLPEDIFHVNTVMTQLVLAGNDFDQVPTALRSAERLKSLDISDNPVRLLTVSSFFKLKHLEELYIRNMPELESIEADTFATQENLQALHIHNNPKLKEFDVEAFGIFWELGGNWSLRQLHLQDNAMEFLLEGTAPWEKIQILDLQGNPWACECTNIWMRRIELLQELTVRLRCGSPAKYEETPLLDAPEELFECHHIEEDLDEYHRGNVHTALLSLLILAALTMALVLLCLIRRRRGALWGRANRNGSVYYVKAHTNPVDSADNMS